MYTPGNTEEMLAASVKPSYKTSFTKLTTAENNYKRIEHKNILTYSSTLFASTGLMPNAVDILAITLTGTKHNTITQWQ